VPAAPFDYDTAPERWGSLDRRRQLAGDVHAPVARLIAGAQLQPVIDVGGGPGELSRHLPPAWPVVTVDLSPAMLASAPHPKLRARAEGLPVSAGSAGAVTMLYHLDRPADAIAEAGRVLRTGGWFVASTSARNSDPELTDGYPPTTFDAAEAEDIVGGVFSDGIVERWDAKLTLLGDHAPVEGFCVHHGLPASAAARVTPPVLLTKRGCLVYARKETVPCLS
jgi:SAM-dependent methyltransferase